MKTDKLRDDFYDKIKPRLYRRVGRELRLAHRVLDLGCGDCALARYLSDTYGQETIGVDISFASFPDKWRTNGNWQRIRCIRDDAARLDSIEDESIDAIVMFWSLHEMNNLRAVLQQAHRVLRTAGKMLVVEFPRNSLAQKLWNENYYSSKELTGFLRKCGFKDIRAERIEHKQILWVTGFRGKTRSQNEEIIGINTPGTPQELFVHEYGI